MSLDLGLRIEVDTGNEPYSAELFDGNYTHNVTPMWRMAGVYDALYNSDGWQALDVIKTLEYGIHDMVSRPEAYRELNPKNGWGDYDGALRFLREFYEACRKYPKAIIQVSK